MNTLIPSELTSDQRYLATVIIKKCTEHSGFHDGQIKEILLGMTVGGPLGIGCPGWKIRAMAEQIETGPPWTEDLFADLEINKILRETVSKNRKGSPS